VYVNGAPSAAPFLFLPQPYSSVHNLLTIR
jgi:hypothetical protein